MLLQKRLAWPLFVLLLATLVFCQPIELILGSFFFSHKLSNFTPPPLATVALHANHHVAFDAHCAAANIASSMADYELAKTWGGGAFVDANSLSILNPFGGGGVTFI